ncbi:MAG: TIM44-like domain-containing protein [bacterium]|nr:TIM44-like domain-containing protein [bacterium]
MKAWAFSVFLLAAWIAPAHLGAPAWTGGHFALVKSEAEAGRFGGGRSFGFRGSRGAFRPRSFGSRGFGSGAGSRPSPGGSRSYRPIRSPFGGFGGLGGGLMGGLGGFFLGGILGRMFFGGGGMGMGGGIGILEILLIGGLIFFAIRFFSRRSEAPRYSGPSGYAAPGADPYGVGGDEHEAGHGEPPRGGGVYRGPDISPGGGGPAAATAADPGMEAGLSAIAAADPSFTREKFLDESRSRFLKFQAAWVARDLGPVRDLADKDLLAEVERDLEALRRERRINWLDDIEIRQCEAVEAWQEEGFDFITVHYDASLIDCVVSEDSGEVLEGSRTHRVGFTEYWTWTRRSGGGAWFLSSISQG